MNSSAQLPVPFEDGYGAGQGYGGAAGSGSWYNNPGLWSGLASNAGSIASGMMGNSGKPYEAASEQYDRYGQMGAGVQNPFLNMGTQAIPQLQQWLAAQKDPSQFINNLMGQYQESPWARYQQEQANRIGMNQASENGLLGSTPFLQQSQQNAANISSGDMQNWLSRVLGINTQYGQGLGNEVTSGQNAANALNLLYGQLAQAQGQAAYGQRAGENQDKSNLWGGLLGTAGTLAGAYFGGPVGASIGGSLGSSLGNSFG